MSDEKFEKRVCRKISERKSIEIEVVKAMRKIGAWSAVERFLPENVREDFLRRGDYLPDGESVGEKMINVCFCSLGYQCHRAEFYKTEEGRVWYDSNVKDRSYMTLLGLDIDVRQRKFVRAIRSGEAVTRRKLAHVGFKG